MKISLIIPAYNASSTIEKAIFSAHHFDCIDEVIIIEDGSKDNTLKTCESLIKKYDKLKLFIHPKNENKGAGASRSLGVIKAKNEWIAFLDADDIFLANRFDKELEYHGQRKEFDGVYGAINAFYSSDEKRKEFLKIFKTDITTVRKPIEPENLKYLLLQMYKGNHGYFSLDGLTVKKSLLLEVGLFNEKLRLHQDTDMIVKLSCKGKLVYGSIDKPVSSRGVHDNNRITSSSSNFGSRYLMYKELQKWISKNLTDQKINDKLNLDVLCYQFLNDQKNYNIWKACKYTRKHKGLFYNTKYFNLLVNNSSASSKIKSLFIRVKEKYVLMFLNKKVNLHSIYVNR